MNTSRITYVKALRIAKRTFEVSIEREDGTHETDLVFRDGIRAEKRAKRLAVLCNCEYGIDY
jgi:hypothetical protein